MPRALALSAVALLSLACSSPDPGLPGSRALRDAGASPSRLSAHWTISTAFTEEEREEVARAVLSWGEASGLASPTVSVGPVGPVDAFAVEPADETGTEGRLGEARGDDVDHAVVATGEIRRRFPDAAEAAAWISVVAAHEVGHVLMRSGEHSEDPHCVMYRWGNQAVADGTTGATPGDARMLEDAWAIGL